MPPSVTCDCHLIMPKPTVFLGRKFPICSIIRPTETVGAARGAVTGLAASGCSLASHRSSSPQ
jgi:hypothetical protein